MEFELPTLVAIGIDCTCSCKSSYHAITTSEAKNDFNQRSHQNPYIEEEQTTHWPKEKVQKDKQRSTKHTHKTKDRVARTPQKFGVNSDALEGYAVLPATLVAPVLLIKLR
jgi:hypothetical protein